MVPFEPGTYHYLASHPGEFRSLHEENQVHDLGPARFDIYLEVRNDLSPTSEGSIKLESGALLTYTHRANSRITPCR